MVVRGVVAAEAKVAALVGAGVGARVPAAAVAAVAAGVLAAAGVAVLAAARVAVLAAAGVGVRAEASQPAQHGVPARAEAEVPAAAAGVEAGAGAKAQVTEAAQVKQKRTRVKRTKKKFLAQPAVRRIVINRWRVIGMHTLCDCLEGNKNYLNQDRGSMTFEVFFFFQVLKNIHFMSKPELRSIFPGDLLLLA